MANSSKSFTGGWPCPHRRCKNDYQHGQHNPFHINHLTWPHANVMRNVQWLAMLWGLNSWSGYCTHSEFRKLPSHQISIVTQTSHLRAVQYFRHLHSLATTVNHMYTRVHNVINRILKFNSLLLWCNTKTCVKTIDRSTGNSFLLLLEKPDFVILVINPTISQHSLLPFCEICVLHRRPLGTC